MAKATVLLIEDDPTILRALKDNFEFDGYRVMTADGGNAGLQVALKCQPDLSSLMLEMQGWVAMRHAVRFD